MNFSKIKAIRIKNFRCLEELTIRFDNSPIIALVAGNDSGKSSAVKGVQAAFYNDEKDTKSYIRTGTKGFEIDVIFEDNIIIKRTKTAANNTYTLYNADGTIKNTWDRMTQDIPDEVRAIFGVKIEDATGELLNLRTCESLLLFSLTKTTDNYKMVHSCISSELIEMTYIIGNGRIKEIERTISKSETLRDEMYSQANKIAVYSEDTINKLTQDHAQVNNMLRLESSIFDTCLAKLDVDAAQAAIDSMDTAKLDLLIRSKFTEREMDTLVKLAQLNEAMKEIQRLSSELQTEKVGLLVKERFSEDALNKLDQLSNFLALHRLICDKKKTTVDEERLTVLDKAREQMNTLSQQFNELAGVCVLLHNIKIKMSEAESISAQLTQTIDELKATGVVRYNKETNCLVTTCEHCNEEVSFNLNDLQLVD